MIFELLLKAIFITVNAILMPINAFVNTFIPSLNTAFSDIATYLNMAFSYIGWAISASGIPYAIILLIIAWYTFQLTVPLFLWLFKTGIAWYHTLKP